ncbi:mechanosensitive ion channel family protein [Parasphingorhabdus sp. JC815]|uniref:mechanosensitive ion channel family protein n=1 Tax=Parasphingorhabdus sp. JC815 TaxID=3232140 RepID=UPI0034584A39
MKIAIIIAMLILGYPVVPLSAQSFPSIGDTEENAAQSVTGDDKSSAISTSDNGTTDEAIARRLQGIYQELKGLEKTVVAVDSGVVSLSGSLAKPGDITRAEQIALRVDGVVAVQNSLTRDADVSRNLAPVMEQLNERIQQLVQLLPLLGIAIVIIIIFWLLGSLVARAKRFWSRVSPNIFLADLLATTVRLLLTLIGIVIALDLLGATTLIGAILGSAGLIGLALGFAIKDTVDNYISSLMLSIRQPFRANDHVVIGDREGRVLRLTSRATILMTLDGNHLRIPNSTVFRAEILNYSRNPERRFDFILGVDADDDPGIATKVGTECLLALPFVLKDPAPGGRLEEVGDSNIMLRFVAWVDQNETDWFKARSAAIRAVKITLEAQGFGLPEPIYRLRFDSGSPLEIARGTQSISANESKPQPRTEILKTHDDVSIDKDIEEKVNDERQSNQEQDMLDEDRPIE